MSSLRELAPIAASAISTSFQPSNTKGAALYILLILYRGSQQANAQRSWGIVGKEWDLDFKKGKIRDYFDKGFGVGGSGGLGWIIIGG